MPPLDQSDRSPAVNWGRSKNFSAELGAAGVVQPARLIQVDGSGEPPRVGLIQLSRKQASAASGGSNVDWRARIGAGVGSATQEFDVDWIEGCQIQVPFQTLYVDAVMFTPRPTSFSTVGLDVTLGALLGFGPASAIPPTYSQQLPDVAAASTGASVRPATMARAVSLYPGFVTAPTIDPYAVVALELVRPGGTFICRIPGPVLAGGAAIPLPASAWVRVVNLDVAAACTPQLVWHLSAG